MERRFTTTPTTRLSKLPRETGVSKSWPWNGGPTVPSAPSSWSPASQKDKSPSRTTKPFQHLQRLVAAVVHNRSLGRGSRLRPDALMPLDSPRLYPCRCEPQNRRSFSPLAELLPERTSPEPVYPVS